jgi:putative ABC transport system ATP-binding protein
MELIAGLNRDRGITVLMVTHEADMAAYAKRIVRFVDGRIASDEPNAAPVAAGRPPGTAAPAAPGTASEAA